MIKGANKKIIPFLLARVFCVASDFSLLVARKMIPVMQDGAMLITPITPSSVVSHLKIRKIIASVDTSSIYFLRYLYNNYRTYVQKDKMESS